MDVNELKDAGAGRLAPDGIVALYHLAFQNFGEQALWNRRPSA
jgi:hypothetical protein